MAGLVDKIAFWRRTIYRELPINKHLTVFFTDKPGCEITLKFSYPGNIQYHDVREDDLETVLKAYRDFRAPGR